MTQRSGSPCNAAPMDAPGEGLDAANFKRNKVLKMKPRGGRNLPASSPAVSYHSFLAFCGYGANFFFGLIGAILAPARDLCQTMGALFPWWQAILPVSGPFRPFRTHCIAPGMGLVLGPPSLGWFGAVCVVECALRTWYQGVVLLTKSSAEAPKAS